MISKIFSELEDRSIGIIWSREHKEKRIKENEYSLRASSRLTYA